MSYIDKINRDGTDYDIQDSKAARSVEGTTASHVLQANEIYTATTQTQFEEFIFRTTGGDVSLETGDAIIEAIFGGISKDSSVPHIPESTTATGTFANEETTVTINKDTWRGKVTTSGDYTFSYNGSNWRLDGSNVTLSQYGLTVDGTVTSGDTIIVEYTRLSTGALTVATPTSFVSTGFNQYDDVAGYAHVVGGNQYRIAGTYTSLTISDTPSGTTSPLSVADNRFIPENDGYVRVVGGSGNILIALVWSGIMNDEPFSAYEESVITIPTKDADNNNLPTATYGLPGIGNIRDSISFTDKVYTQRIARLPYTIANLETLEGAGAEYGVTMIYDASYIYYALQQPVVYQLAESTTDTYIANDFGTEEFTGTTVPIYTGLRYGNSLVDKLRNLVDIQEVGDGLEMDGSTIKTAYELNDDVPTGFFSGEAQVSGEGTNIELDNTSTAKLKSVQLNGDSEQDVDHGKNLMPMKNISVTNSVREIKFAMDLPAGTYTISFNLSSYTLGTNTDFGVQMGLMSSRNTQVKDVNLITIKSSTTAGRKSTTFTIAEDVSGVYASNIRVPAVNYDKGARVSITDIQIEAGEEATSYTPYIPLSPDSPVPIKVVTGAQNIIVRGKNLINIDGDWTYGTTNNRTTPNGDGTVTSTSKFGSSRSAGQHIVGMKPNTEYTITTRILHYAGDTTSSLGAIDIVNFIDDANVRVGYQYIGSRSVGVPSEYTSKTFITPEDTSGMWISLNGITSSPSGSAPQPKVVYTDVQLELGDKYTGFVENNYAQQFTIDLGSIELCKAGVYQDSIYKVGEDWFLHKEIAKITFDGVNEAMTNIYGNGISEDYTFVSRQMTDMMAGLQVGLCDKLPISIGSPNGANKETIFFGTTSNDYLYMGVLSSRTNNTRTVTAFNTFLEDNPITVYYVLKTSTDTKITNATLIGQLNALANATSADNKTNIIVYAADTNLASPLLVTAYQKDVPGIVANI